ncbi:MAG: outer membrane lipoprotein carrier protein LolA [Rhodocyclaceae bacterium]|nr:MAG: outer membrane lipoprotein carrier protein LolA [Rhodocyclaceae bacterium]
MNRQMFMIFLAAIVCMPSLAGTPDLLPSITKQIEQHPVVRADFVQTKRMIALKRPLVSKGRMIFSRKEGVFWLIDEPIRVSYWLGDLKIIEVSPDGQRKEQDTKSNPALTQISRVMRSMLGAQTEALKENFDVQARGSATQWELDLVPKQAQLAQYVRSIKVRGGRFIEVMTLEEVSGDTTQTHFSASEALGEVPASDIQRFAKTK